MDIRFDHVSKRRDEEIVLADVSFPAYAGQITVVLSAAMAPEVNCLPSRTWPSRGGRGNSDIRWTAYSRGRPHNFGISLEAVANPASAVETHLAIRAQRLGLPNESVMNAMKLLQILPLRRRRIGRLSLGQRQRVSLAAALLGQPGVLMLDEPANGMDPDGIMWLNHYLKHRAAVGATVLVSSHSLAELDNLVDSVVVLDRSVRWANGSLTCGAADSARSSASS